MSSFTQPSYFLPWDPLQLVDAVDGGHRVYRNSVLFTPYRQFGGQVIWNSVMDNGIGLYYDNDDELDTFINLLVTQSARKFHESANINYYDFDSQHDYSKLAEEHYNFKYIPFEQSYGSFLKGVKRHREKIQKLSLAIGRKEAPNKKVEILVLDIPQRMMNEVNRNIDDLLDILANSSDERLHCFFVTPFAEGFNPDLFANFSQNYFIGDINSTYVREKLCKGWEFNRNSIRQKLIGLGILSFEATKLSPLHPRKYTLNDYTIKYFEELDAEEAEYRKFLDSLE